LRFWFGVRVFSLARVDGRTRDGPLDGGWSERLRDRLFAASATASAPTATAARPAGLPGSALGLRRIGWLFFFYLVHAGLLFARLFLTWLFSRFGKLSARRARFSRGSDFRLHVFFIFFIFFIFI
jgi:hypothetical protein